MSQTVLNSPYVPPELRPYSQNELNFLRRNLHEKLRLGSDTAQHHDCGHFYYVRLNSRKEKEIQESKSANVGNCSVCWKLRKTPRNLVPLAKSLITQYNEMFRPDEEKFSLQMTYDMLDVETVYYKWLFIERE